jgi:hypothetical protein
LYTSLEREGALAEISYYWAQLTPRPSKPIVTPRPSKPIVVHRLTVVATRTLNLVRTDLERFGVDMARFSERDYSRTQQIGGACAFLGYDELESEEVDWQAWARETGVIDDS